MRLELTDRGHGVDVSWALRQREAQQIGPGKLDSYVESAAADEQELAV